MVTQAFKGVIGTGTISARFESDDSNRDSDILVIAYSAVGGGDTAVDREVIVPGGSGVASVVARSDGIVEVLVSIGDESDSGHLQVLDDGEVEDEDDIDGSVRWIYSVQEGG